MSDIVVIEDLRLQFGPARNQGARPTCLAFAASDTHAAARGEWSPLSCEYLFFQAQRRSSRLPTQGALPAAILGALKKAGQPEEDWWPYLPKSPEDENTWHPPGNSIPLYGRNGRGIAASIADVIGLIDKGTPLVLLMSLSRSFFRPTGEGVVTPAIGEQPEPERRHAVIAVAHGFVDNKRSVLVRNSWGQRWGVSGYAWLTEDFLAPRLWGALELLEDVDVSGSSAAA
ncbi:C1 family peptidase [Mesorhizobium sp. M7A.F.Ce.TU.012.03.2.1]|uniref:C1 family peptidase n=1 Tax=Mesorhizobium sp. M7A.F.Ce.TU.012.03.2.1 TaxID=2493681 RepID=UPI000FD95600|nr:C1 family peptidase [Mesorhizobium sp. M7A.F.Ce.TU.012.03.2.1]AZV18112.1 peptidase C1 [Mesorhizobium sp. M7A.F.Ce.TU.012.03.2.1]